MDFDVAQMRTVPATRKPDAGGALYRPSAAEQESKPKRTLTPEHKEAARRGLEQAMVVRRYLEAIDSNRLNPRRRSAGSIVKRLAAIDGRLESAGSLSRLYLRQERIRLKRELEAGTAAATIPALEARFIDVAREFGERKKIDYDGWRAYGVRARVLKAAGIDRP